MHRAFLLGLFFLTLPFTASGAVIISEIMYDVPGVDTGREWIEVQNDGSLPVDISGFKLFEANTNHKLTLVQGGGELSPGGYAVIADNTEKFLLDNPGYSGVLFDSAFSLANTTETLVVKNGDLEEDSVTYSSETGALGDGQTLQLIGSMWETGNPTPGVSNAASAPPQEEEVEESEDTTEESPAPSQEKKVSAAPVVEEEKNDVGIPLTLAVKAGADRTMVVGAAEFFRAQAFRRSGPTEKNAKYRWNFGNGFMRHGQEILFQYNFPGKYVALVTAEGPNDAKAFARFTVTVEPARVAVSGANSVGITLLNADKRELNLSLWSLRVNDRHFMLPEDTILLPGAAVLFPSEVTGLFPRTEDTVALVYPNGKDAAVYTKEQKQASVVTAGVVGAPHVVLAASQTGSVEVSVPETRVSTTAMAGEAQPMVAAAAESNFEEVPWFLGLLVLIVGGLLALFSIRNRSKVLMLEGYEIVEAPSTLPAVLPQKEESQKKE